MGSPVVKSELLLYVKDKEASKMEFLSAVNLIAKPAAASILSREKTIPTWLQQKLRFRKNNAAAYFRKNPVPLSSNLGKKILIAAGDEKRVHPKDEVARYEKHCVGGRRSARDVTRRTWPVKNARKFNEPGGFFHKYTFNKSQKAERLNELGLNKKSCDMYNLCNGFAKRVTIRETIHTEGQPTDEENEEHRSIASEPVPLSVIVTQTKTSSVRASAALTLKTKKKTQVKGLRSVSESTATHKWIELGDVERHLIKLYYPGEKMTYKCKICSKVFKKSDKCRYHLKAIHVEKPPKPCKFAPQCTAVFYNNRGVSEHLRFRHGEVP